MLGKCLRWIKRWEPLSRRVLSQPGTTASTPAPEAPEPQQLASKSAEDARGHAEGWLRILPSSELMALVQSRRAVDAMWRQSRLSRDAWGRDLEPALQRFAEFVQLMPASESHHHAHVGGLLAHAIETTLAAMTWRNGHFFPEGASVEEMDEQRDEWTYVVFFASLLHDVGKIMADLRVKWTTAGMAAPLRWTPTSGSLVQLSHLRDRSEYLVEFTPKSARDYAAHSKLPVILLQQVAPATALSFLARRPQAFEALTHYLEGADKTSQLAQLVRKADQASTQQALANGSRARFSTSSSVPLIDLLMLAIKDMLRTGTALPLNRSGAAGWIYDGSIWFVAKRLADGVRQHIKLHHPEEAVPGENKNDRLFDTWQEYGVIAPNPETGQAVWYVQVQGGAATDQVEGSELAAEENMGEATSYTHALTMLRFPLARLYDSPEQYPPEMHGQIVIQAKAVATGKVSAGASDLSGTSDDSGATPEVHESGQDSPEKSKLVAPHLPNESKEEAQGRKRPKPVATSSVLRAPKFAQPGRAKSAPNKPSAPLISPSKEAQPSSSSFKDTIAATDRPETPPTEPIKLGEPDGFGIQDKWLDFEDDAAMFDKPPSPIPSAPPIATKAARKAQQVKAAPKPKKQEIATTKLPELPANQPLLVRAGMPMQTARTLPKIQHTPVVLTPFLPELPHETADKKAEPSEAAIDFMSWLQQGLAERTLKYNETGAMVHFTAEGMALVSPVIFKSYAAEIDPSKDSEAQSQALQVQREVIKAGWHLMGPGKTNILKYQVLGRGNSPVGKLSAIVLINPERWVMPVPPSNPVLKLAEFDRDQRKEV